MLVSDILKHKGSDVKVVNSNESALFFAQRLRDEHVGAMVVSDDGQQIDGIISERDVGLWPGRIRRRAPFGRPSPG